MLIGGIVALSLVVAVVSCFTSGAFLGLGWLWVLPVSFVGSFLSLAVLAFLFLWLLAAIVDMEKAQEHDSPFYRGVLKLYIPAIMTILQARVHTEGTEKIPTDSRFLLVCNHINDMDPVTLLHVFPNSQLAFISKRENDKRFIVGPMLHRIMCQPINRENDREALKTILNCVRLLKEDEVSIAVFPEGYTSMDGLLRHFRSGVFKIAQKTKLPIVVCTVKNTNQLFKNAPKLISTDVYVHLLDVLQPEDYEGMTTVELGDKVYHMMADDLGPALVLETAGKEE